MHAKRLLVCAALALLGTNYASASTVYTYDDLGRLWKVCVNNTTQIVYTYDPAGNRTQVVTTNTTC
jgi:hypothetical protein